MIEIENLSLDGVKLIKTKKFIDDKGRFSKIIIKMNIKNLEF